MESNEDSSSDCSCIVVERRPNGRRFCCAGGGMAVPAQPPKGARAAMPVATAAAARVRVACEKLPMRAAAWLSPHCPQRGRASPCPQPLPPPPESVRRIRAEYVRLALASPTAPQALRRWPLCESLHGGRHSQIPPPSPCRLSLRRWLCRLSALRAGSRQGHRRVRAACVFCLRCAAFRSR